jgi:uncharacterized membrane protein YkoI
MKNKSILLTSAFVTVFLITVGIGVVTNVTAQNKPAAPTADVSAFVQREQAYQQIINEANQRIGQANEQITTLLNVTQSPTSAPVSQYLFTPEQASALAQTIAGSAPEQLPTLVSFSGTPAYEVVYANGNIYVDANSGAVLYNGLQKKSTYVTSDQAINIAKTYLNSNDVVSVNFGVFNGANAYIVSFSNGQSVYVNLYGKIVAVQMAQQSSSSSPQTGEHDDD